MPPRYVVAVARQAPMSIIREVIYYVGVPPTRSEAHRTNHDGWWLIEPGRAADKPGESDYTRFDSSEDAVALCLRLQAHYEDRVAGMIIEHLTDVGVLRLVGKSPVMLRLEIDELDAWVAAGWLALGGGGE